MGGLWRPQNIIPRYSCDTADCESALRRNGSSEAVFRFCRSIGGHEPSSVRKRGDAPHSKRCREIRASLKKVRFRAGGRNSTKASMKAATKASTKVHGKLLRSCGPKTRH